MKHIKTLLHVSVGSSDFRPTNEQVTAIREMVEEAVAKMGLEVGVLATNHMVNVTPIYINNEES